MHLPPGAPFKTGGLLALLGLETLAPYRAPTQPRLKRWAVNITLAVANALLLSKLVELLAPWNLKGPNLLAALASAPFLRLGVGLILLDLALYLWHRANHRTRLLWKIHRVHHSDLDLDVTTAGRFHLLELALWTPLKVALALALGLGGTELLQLETIVTLTSQFQHSAVKLPAKLEKALGLLTFGPTHHRIHHSIVIGEGNTNYGTILSVWDRLFSTHHGYADSTRITIGLHKQPKDLSLPALLKMPFARAAG